MSTVQGHIKDLLIFYIDTNYNHYLEVTNKENLDDEELDKYVREIYKNKREDSIEFIKQSLKKLLNKEYPGDHTVMNIINSYDDDEKNIINIINHIKLKNKK